MMVTGSVSSLITLTRTIKPMVTGQAPVTLEWKNTPGKKHKQTKKGGRRIDYIVGEAINSSNRNI